MRYNRAFHLFLAQNVQNVQKKEKHSIYGMLSFLKLINP